MEILRFYIREYINQILIKNINWVLSRIYMDKENNFLKNFENDPEIKDNRY